MIASVASGPAFVIQVAYLLVALALGSVIGLEREIREKSAGLRTHTLVSAGAGLFMLVSKYGFADLISDQQIHLDPSRVAAQIVSGIGFIGAGVIFVQRHSIKGLTTAATVWLAAAVGAAAGAGMLALATVTTVAYVTIAILYRAVDPHIPDRGAHPGRLEVHYRSGNGTLERVIELCESRGFQVTAVRQVAGEHVVHIDVRGQGRLATLAILISDLEGILHASALHTVLVGPGHERSANGYGLDQQTEKG
jgi:putative Mg2+ transporter-C (MgtC) family protein